jgi:hypothetical protein
MTDANATGAAPTTTDEKPPAAPVSAEVNDEIGGSAVADTTDGDLGDDEAAGDTELAADGDDETRVAPEGVPDSPDDYELPAIDGYAWATEGDAGETVQGFLEAAHQADVPQEAVAALGTWYAERIGQLKAAREEADADDAEGVEAALVEEWGAQYDTNLKAAKRWLRDAGELGAALRAARLPDGRRLANLPELVHLLADLGKGRPAGSADATPERQSRATMAERAELAKLLRADPQMYRFGSWRGKDQTPADRAEELRPKSARELELSEIMHRDIGELHRRKNGFGQTLADELDELRRGKRKPAA